MPEAPTPPFAPSRLRGGLLLGCALAVLLAGCGERAEPPDPLKQPPAPPVATAPAPPPAAPAAEPEPPVAAAPAPMEDDATQPSLARPTLSFARTAGLHRTPDPLRLTAAAALVVDPKTDQVLYRKNDDAVLPIASLTKLMTALVIAKARMDMDEPVTVTEEDVDQLRHSRSRLRVGTTLRRAEALHLALMSSENRAAHALGRHYPGGLPAFVEAMNQEARALGMKDTVFVDPTGLSNRNQSSARDLAVLVETAARHPLLRDFSTTPRWVADFNGRRVQYLNSNRLIKDPDWDIALQKTGYIVEAGQCLTMQARVAGRDLVMVLLDAGSKGSRSADAERLRKWAVAQAEAGGAQAAAPAASSAPGKS